MTEYEESAIIGYWRSGASETDIYYLTGINPDKIKKFIQSYASKNKEDNSVTKVVKESTGHIQRMDQAAR